MRYVKQPLPAYDEHGALEYPFLLLLHIFASPDESHLSLLGLKVVRWSLSSEKEHCQVFYSEGTKDPMSTQKLSNDESECGNKPKPIIHIENIK